ncbi:MAG: dipeptidase PepV [Clostridiales Family XIII bacterium]|jgi:succinyl-diaminopimelate desuccinylase|nr:dipeptidase PepV [Clostridiales Family XIII bacterium]
MISTHKYKELIEARRDDVVAMLRELIAVESVQGEPKDGKPFGEGVSAVYEGMLSRGRSDGFETADVDGYGGHIEWPGAELDANGEIVAGADEVLGIPVHLDVVPAGGDWSKEPFGAEVADGMICGRGSTDNKNAVAAVYCAMKALKDSGFVPRKSIRLILGLDEETGWSGMEKYLAGVGAPDFGFVPDADFPAINGEKGIIDFELAKKLGKTIEKGLALRSVKGGAAPNMVPDHAAAIVMDEIGRDYAAVKEQIAAYRERTGYKVYGKGVGRAFEISARGVSAHGARPEEGVNAISVLLDFLYELGLANESVRDFLTFYHEHIGFDSDGARMGVGFSDDPSGKLTLNVGLIAMDSEAAILTVNARYPVTMREDSVYEAMLPLIHEYDLGIVKLHSKPPIYFPEDDPFIETLMEVYRENTGDTKHKPFVIGGGTYARAIPNAVAFGPRFPGREELMHRKDERISIDDLMRTTHIYADAIYKLTGED